MIVGRSDECSALDQALDAAEAGTSTCAMVLAEPGMGATTLLAHLRAVAEARGWSTAAAAAPDGGAATPFALVHDVFTELLWAMADAGGLVRDWQATLIEPTTWTPASMATSLHDYLVSASRSRCVLVTIDDLQWADDESVACLALAAGRLVDARVALVGAAHPPRDDDDPLAGWARVRLGPLLPADARSLLTAIITDEAGGEADDTRDGPLDDATADVVADALGRCPQAIVECRRLLTPAQVRGQEPLPDPVPISEGLRHAWSAVLDALSPGAQRAAIALSVLGTSRLELVSRLLADVDVSLGDLQEARRAGLLIQDTRGATVIASPTVRAAVRSWAPSADRRAMQRLVARIADDVGAPIAVCASHWEQAGRPGDEDVAAELDRQAQRAAARDQPDVAARAWKAAAAITQRPALRRDYAVRASRTWLLETTSPRGAKPLLDLLGQTRLHPADEVWREWLRAEVVAAYDLHQAADAALVAARHARSAHAELVPWLLWDAAAMAWTADDPHLALMAARELAEWTAPSMPGAGTHPRWLGTAVLGAALLESGDSHAGSPLMDRAIAQSATWTPHPRTRLADLVNAVALDELLLVTNEQARVRRQELLARLRDDAGPTTAATTVLLGWDALRRGDLPSAATEAQQAMALAQAVRAPTERVAALSLLANVQALTDPSAAAATIASLRASASTLGHRRGVADADHAAGLVALLDGNLEAAVRHLERVHRCRLQGRGAWDTLVSARADLVEAYVRSARGADAAKVMRTLRATLTERAPSDPASHALLLRTEAVLMDDDASAGLLDEACRCAAAARDPIGQARAHLAAGEHLRRHHRPKDARGHLIHAADLFDAAGARAWARRARDEQSGAPGSRGPARIHGLAPGGALALLTPAEQRVVQAIGDGRSTRQAAATLVLSPRTVEFHLASAYRKLGVHNRAQLVNLVRSSNDPRPA